MQGNWLNRNPPWPTIQIQNRYTLWRSSSIYPVGVTRTYYRQTWLTKSNSLQHTHFHRLQQQHSATNHFQMHSPLASSTRSYVPNRFAINNNEWAMSIESKSSNCCAHFSSLLLIIHALFSSISCKSTNHKRLQHRSIPWRFYRSDHSQTHFSSHFCLVTSIVTCAFRG